MKGPGRAPAAAARARRLRIRRRRLQSGLTLLAARSRAAPTLSLVASFRAGRIVEAPEEAGFAHLTGAALQEGTERWSGERLAEVVEGAGGHLATSGSAAVVRTAAADAKLAVRILAEVVRRPTFPEKGVARVKALALAELRSELDEPQTVASRAFRAKVYGAHPLGRPAKGTLATVERATPARLRRFHERWFTPARTIVCGVGDVDPEELLDLLERAFRGWQAKERPDPKLPELKLPDAPEHEHIRRDRAQVQVYLGHLGIERKDPDYYRLLVMDHILGSGAGFTDRISRRLRDEEGLCYVVGAGITGSAGLHRGLFSAYIGTSPDKVERAIEGFLEEIRRIREEPPTARELADVKAYLTGSYVWTLEQTTNLARFLVRCERFELGDDYLARYPDLIRAVTARQVRDAAHRHLHPDRYTCVTLGPQR